MLDLIKKTNYFYHGTFEEHVKSIETKIKIDKNIKYRKGRKVKTVDNGPGFYLAFNKQQAIDFVKDKRNKKPVIMKFEMNKEIILNLESKDIKIFDKENMSDDCAGFILNNRLNDSFRDPNYPHNDDGKYKIVANLMADNISLLTKVEKNKLEFCEALRNIKQNTKGLQISLHCEELIENVLNLVEVINCE